MDDVPNWHEYFMCIAQAVSLRSKDCSTKVGAVLVDANLHIIGTGYNGFAPGAIETPERWERPAKYQFVVHAEVNCLAHATKAARGATLYTTMFPCVECAKLIMAAGIKEIVYRDDKYWSDITAQMLNEGSIQPIRL